MMIVKFVKKSVTTFYDLSCYYYISRVLFTFILIVSGSQCDNESESHFRRGSLISKIGELHFEQEKVQQKINGQCFANEPCQEF